jgi:hypothetical protein
MCFCTTQARFVQPNKEHKEEMKAARISTDWREGAKDDASSLLLRCVQTTSFCIRCVLRGSYDRIALLNPHR